jgi:hypothetical protein
VASSILELVFRCERSGGSGEDDGSEAFIEDAPVDFSPVATWFE